MQSQTVHIHTDKLCAAIVVSHMVIASVEYLVLEQICYGASSTYILYIICAHIDSPELQVLEILTFFLLSFWFCIQSLITYTYLHTHLIYIKITTFHIFQFYVNQGVVDIRFF